jgi:hypothetical protein
MTARKRGRPALGENARTKIVGVRFTPAELARIESVAAGEGVEGGQTAGEWIRRRALEALGDE